MLRADVVRRNDRLARFHNVTGLQTQAVGDQGERFLQTGVAGFAGFEEAPEFGGRQAAADFPLQRGAAGRGVNDALNVDGADFSAHARQADGQKVHDETRVHTGADHARAGLSANSVEPGGQGRLAELGKYQLLAGGDHADPVAGYWLDLSKRVLE